MVSITNNSQKICRDFAKHGSCRFKSCRYAHSRRDEIRSHDPIDRRTQRDNKRDGISEFAIWKRQLGNHQSSRPLGEQLGPFFEKARKLIDIDEGILQDVIKCLSNEDGLKRIQELVERDFDSIPKPAKRRLFIDQMLPFLEIITHPNILASLVMEQAVGTIYNCLYGIAGRRGKLFLGFLSSSIQLEIETDGKAAAAYLERSLLVFQKMVELNSTAFIQEPLKPVAQRFADLFLTLHALEGADPLHQSRDYLDKLQRRLDIGLSLPTVARTPRQQVSRAPVAFVTDKHPPGGRHDNDHADICKIKIMPTFQEILSPRSEYLPVKDPRQWHIRGLAGLLDRNFRLLREDTVGQLRDAIHAELQPDNRKETWRHDKTQTRTHVYRQVVFLVRFAQPINVRGQKKRKIQEWWELSKRLQPDALVCLVDPRGSAIFCTIASPERPKTGPDAVDKQRHRLSASLSDDANVASVLLQLVEPSESSWQYILDCHDWRENRSSISLPTLLALQRMQKAADLPFTLSILVDVPPPVYAASHEFSFDLKCLMNDGSTLKVQASQPVDLERLQRHSTLDDAQASALVRTLQRKIGLIQGPPGTGKTNKAKVRNGLGPIICLLEDLLDNKITSQIIRIGSQSKSERLQPLNLRSLARRVDKTRLEKSEQWHLHMALDGHEAQFHKLRLNSRGSVQNHYNQLFGQDKEGFQTRRKGTGKKSKAQPRSVDELAKVHVDMMTAAERKALHDYWMSEHRKDSYLQAQSTFAAHLKTKASWDTIRDEIDLRWLARNLEMLRRLPSKVLLCEEAGEVLEAHLLTSLLPSLEQVMLIGDHQQLRPQIQNYDLSRESRTGNQYSLDRSLFERLVEPDEGVGRRMHPSISQLDASSVFLYPEVTGLLPEGNASGEGAMVTSYWNDHEVQLTGTYQSGDIAVLTPYLGQLHRMRRKLSESFTITVGERDQEDLAHAGFTADQMPSEKTAISKSTLLHALRVATIDNFQGEEAKVVNRCGFLRTSNRINVLLSRAKHGIGIEMWGKVLDMLEQEGNIGDTLELNCPRHPETPIAVSQPEHFIQYSPEGGCSLQCGKRLKCGHPCKQKCHSEMLHLAVYCPEECQRPLKGCTHPCPRPCGDTCPQRCVVTVFDTDRLLPCGHPMASLPCWQAQDLSVVKCPTLVDREIPHCHHRTRLACHIDVVSSLLPCGHSCKRQCLLCTERTADGPHVDHGKCTQKCGRLYSTCAHTCNAECHGDTPCPPCTSPCDVQCGHSRCPQKCSEPCAPCAVSECLSSCAHSSCSMPCAAPCDHIPCSLRCEKILSCGHQCPSVCGEPCPSSEFCQVCATDSIKETMVDFIMGEQYREIDLSEKPCIFPQCGHFLTIESMDAQMDLKKHYIMDEKDRPISIASSSQPFSIDDIRTCAICRGSLRNVSRYGRLVRRALLDEATKKFILYLNQQCISQLQSDKLGASPEQTASLMFQADLQIRIEGDTDNQMRFMSSRVSKYDTRRWRELMVLRNKISEYKRRVKVEEQPFSQVRNMVESARRRKKTSGLFVFDESVLQTKGHIQAASLLLRLDTALLADFLSLCKQLRPHASQSYLYVNLAESRRECKCLIADAVSSRRVLQQVEGNLFLAQFCALERQTLSDPAQAETLLQEGTAAIEEAEKLCNLHPGLTRGLSEEIEGTRAMLRGSTFYAPVTNEERMAVLAAMAREFRGTGHWYYCENGHPFTIGECGGAMELSRCPECGAAVGGEHHQTAAGVRRARDLEDTLRNMQV
ncbi:hypothetical protein BDW75DRAFT_252193 [Aspergillus navahoensis]